MLTKPISTSNSQQYSTPRHIPLMGIFTPDPTFADIVNASAEFVLAHKREPNSGTAVGTSSTSDGTTAGTGTAGYIIPNTITKEMLNEAHGLVFSFINKGGMLIGEKNGNGLVLSKLNRGTSDERWSAPLPIYMEGITYGAQIGMGSVKSVTVLKSEALLKRWYHEGEKTLGVDANISVANEGVDAEACITMDNLEQTVTVAHSEGLYFGVTVEQMTFKYSKLLGRAFYGQDFSPIQLLVIGKGTAVADKKCKKLYDALASLS